MADMQVAPLYNYADNLDWYKGRYRGCLRLSHKRRDPLFDGVF